MSKVKDFLVRVWRLWYMKYAVVLVLGVLIVGFLDDNSWWSHVQNDRRIGDLQAEIDKYSSQNERNQEQIRKLETDPKAIEKIARERYFMKAADEDVFVLSDDERGSTVTGYETVE